MKRSAAAVVAVTLCGVVGLAGCQGSNQSSPSKSADNGSNSSSSAKAAANMDPHDWFKKNCPVTLAHATDKDLYPVYRGPLKLTHARTGWFNNDADPNPKYRLYNYDQSTGSVIPAAVLDDKELIVCPMFQGPAAVHKNIAVTVTVPLRGEKAGSSRTTRLLKVTMPAYPAGIWIDLPLTDHDLKADLTPKNDRPSAAIPAVEYGDFAAAAKNLLATGTYCEVHIPEEGNDTACPV